MVSNIRSASFSFVTIHASDRQTDRRTELRQQYRALHYMPHVKSFDIIVESIVFQICLIFWCHKHFLILKAFTHAIFKQELIRRWDTRTWRDVSSYMITLFTTELRHICSTPEYIWSNAYIYNCRGFTKSALCILLLSTFRVSGINSYSLAFREFCFVLHIKL